MTFASQMVARFKTSLSGAPALLASGLLLGALFSTPGIAQDNSQLNGQAVQALKLPKSSASVTQTSSNKPAASKKAPSASAMSDDATAQATGAKSAKSSRSKSLEAQFAAADVDKVGKISKKQAFKAQMYEVDRYFFDMDTDIDGYVTLLEIKTWKANPIRTAPRPRGDKLDRFVDGDAARR
jgi:hypothetical protein